MDIFLDCLYGTLVYYERQMIRFLNFHERNFKICILFLFFIANTYCLVNFLKEKDHLLLCLVFSYKNDWVYPFFCKTT